MEEDDELLDLVDDNDHVVKVVQRASYHASSNKPKGYLRATELFIQNDKGQLWIPRRAAHKLIAPSGLDYSCGGHVTSGEDYLTSLVREIQEELNMDIPPSALRLIKKFQPTALNPWFRCLYRYNFNGVPEYNREDFSEYFWLTPSELLANLEAGEPAKSSMLPTLRELVTVL